MHPRGAAHTTLRVDVSARKCAGGGTFGKAAAKDWRNLLQFADGPKAFDAGVARMLRDYKHSVAHIGVIKALARERDKAHYRRPDL